MNNLVQSIRQQSKHIQIRKTKFIAQNLKQQYTDSTLMSHFLTALSMTFPKGERFFVETIRNVRNKIDDPNLQMDITGFIGQESHHAQAHELFNKSIQSADYQLSKYTEAFEKEMLRLRTLSYRRQLAATVALEHFTAMMAGYMLKHPDFMFKRLSPNMKNLWLWHAVEEIEHKHVAFDVYQSVFSNLAQRRRSMRTITIGFIIGITLMTAHLLWQDRKNSLYKPNELMKNITVFLGLILMMIRLSPEYLAFYRADFHPFQIDQNDLLEKGRALILE
ncbi:MAG: metal-dependent hydrolase [Acinetobacter venetianus]|uniref:metal-dependent hydrolase n=1 Tax=Acinetobacter venetianus TaxID=52133 RepID=UPI003C720556